MSLYESTDDDGARLELDLTRFESELYVTVCHTNKHHQTSVYLSRGEAARLLPILGAWVRRDPPSPATDVECRAALGRLHTAAETLTPALRDAWSAMQAFDDAVREAGDLLGRDGGEGDE